MFYRTCFTGALAYADDVVLLAPTPSAMRVLLNICEEYGKEFSVAFNAVKSVCMQVSKVSQSSVIDLQFTLEGRSLKFVERCTHLGHIISARLDDKCDIVSRRNSLCGKVNNVLVYFGKCDPLVKLKLLKLYCSDLYGSVLWDLSHSCVEDVCIAWRKGLRRALSLPGRTHCDLLPLVTGMLPLKDELLCRTARFLSNCLNCQNSIVKFVSRHGVLFSRTSSIIGLNAQLCSTRLDVRLSDLDSINMKYVRNCISPADNRYSASASVINDLLLVKSKLADVSVLSSTDVDFIIDTLCVS